VPFGAAQRAGRWGPVVAQRESYLLRPAGEGQRLPALILPHATLTQRDVAGLLSRIKPALT
jgi:hypothetical protein